MSVWEAIAEDRTSEQPNWADVEAIERIRDGMERQGGVSSSSSLSQLESVTCQMGGIGKLGMGTGLAELSLLLYLLASPTAALPQHIQAYRLDKASTAPVFDFSVDEATQWAQSSISSEHFADEQPRYSYAETMAYAERLGLPTDFPL